MPVGTAALLSESGSVVACFSGVASQEQSGKATEFLLSSNCAAVGGLPRLFLGTGAFPACSLVWA